MCKSHYVDCLIKELGIDNSLGNPIYISTTLTKEEILDNHRSVLRSFGISTKLHKFPFKQRCIAGSAKCSTKHFSKLLTYILSAVKSGLQSCCDTSYSRGRTTFERIFNFRCVTFERKSFLRLSAFYLWFTWGI